MTRVKNTARQSMTPASLAALLAMALLLTPMVQANSVGTVPLVDQGNQALRKCGAARLKVLFWDIYESSLYTPDGTWSEGVRPLRLDIRYLRAISALDLVKQTGKEWAEQGKSSPQHMVWQGELLSIWPDVTEGDVISLAIDPSGVSTFLFNGNAIGTIGDPQFGEDFAGIWLSPDTTRPALRRQLIGEADA
ncbi:MAG: chalcone isomerase family protein [Luminiphilus sp.]